MKKTSIWILGIVMTVSFCSLLYLQVSNIRQMAADRLQSFEESVTRALYEVGHYLEVEEAREYLERDIALMQHDTERPSQNHPFGETQFSFPDGSVFSFKFNGIPGVYGRPDLEEERAAKSKTIDERLLTVEQDMLKRFVAQQSLVDEVIYSLLHTVSNRPLSSRIDFAKLSNELNLELRDNGIDLPFHFRLTTTTGAVVYTCGCEDFDANDIKNTYSQNIFRNGPTWRMGVLQVYFPTLDDYVTNASGFVIPSLAFLFILLITFVSTLLIVFRQKKLTEIKNDFINNMTHEFKTPISTISLAAQMLTDQSVGKSPQMFKHISGVIIDETKRLRFQVEKVLQMSMFERKGGTIKLKETDIDELIHNVVNTFRLKVENCGGKIDARFETEDPFAMADEMHFTNVIFNLLDNAVKYKRPNVPLNLEIRTWNENNKLHISISDNGIGIKKDDLKKIFEKFYRVHTGNLHDVKGFGLGLAYVKQMVLNHKGTIVAESELGQGTRFLISLPLILS